MAGKKEKHKENDEEARRQTILQYQVIQQQMMQLQQQLQMIENNVMEIEAAKQAVDDLGKAKKGSEVLAPITSGIFVKSELKDNKNFLINVGSNTVVEKDSSKVIELLEKQNQEIRNVQKEMMTNLETLAVKAMHLEAQINQMQR